MDSIDRGSFSMRHKVCPMDNIACCIFVIHRIFLMPPKTRYMLCGTFFMVYGTCSVVHSSCFMMHETYCMVNETSFTVHDSRSDSRSVLYDPWFWGMIY